MDLNIHKCSFQQLSLSTVNYLLEAKMLKKNVLQNKKGQNLDFP